MWPIEGNAHDVSEDLSETGHDLMAWMILLKEVVAWDPFCFGRFFEGTGGDGNNPLHDVFEDTSEKGLGENAVGQDLRVPADMKNFSFFPDLKH